MRSKQWNIPEGWATVHPDKLSVDGENPNQMQKKKRDALLLGLRKEGWLKLIVVDEDYVICDGEHRWELAKENNQPLIPVLVHPMTDAERRINRQVLNRLQGTDDPLILALNYRKIDVEDKRQELIKRLALSEADLRNALEAKKPDEEYKIPALDSVETEIEIGDRHRLGVHILMCGDSTNPEHVDALMNGTIIDCIFTDPPFGVYIADWASSLRGRINTQNPSIYNDEIEDYEKFTLEWMKHIPKHLAEYNSIYIWINGKNIRGLLNASFKLKYKLDNIIIWNKNTVVLSRLDYMPKHEIGLYGWHGKHKFYGKAEKNVWDIPKPSQSKLHPTMKPVALCARAITNSTMPEMTVADLFGGSGSTLIACEQTNRKCRMMEIDIRYCQIIIDRWEAYTGGKASKIEVIQDD